MKRALTITTPKNVTSDLSIWSGRFHFLVTPTCDKDYLQGTVGGFVYAVARAADERDFIEKVEQALIEGKLFGDKEYDDLKDISTDYKTGNLSFDWMERCQSAIGTQDVIFATFHLYDKAED